MTADEIKKNIADLKDKKNILILSVQEEIDVIKRQIVKEYYQIGEKAYGLSKKGINSMDTLAELFARIDRQRDELEAKNKKIEEISESYDEEVVMLERFVPVESVPSQVESVSSQIESVPSQAFCTSCGVAYIPGEDLFCVNCGERLW